MTSNWHRVLVGVLLLGAVACTQQEKPVENAGPPPAPGPDLLALTTENAPQLLAQYGRQYPDSVVLLTTSLGQIKLKLYHDTPLHTANFLLLTRKKFFDEGVFYRVVKDFVIQGGDDDDRTMRLAAYKLPPERNPAHFHRRGAVGMARYGDKENPEQMSSSHDFYIVQGKVYSAAELDFMEKDLKYKFSPAQREAYTTIGGAPELDPGYTVFGEVLEGQDVVQTINQVPVDGQKWPKTEVPMKVTVVGAK